MNRRLVNSAPARGGWTLLELLLAIAILSVLMGAMGSAVFIVTRSIDDGSSNATIINDTATVVDQIAADLKMAISFNEADRTPTSVQFTVPDRDDDGSPETIRYAWSGLSGDPVTREYNGSAPVAVIDHAESFDLDYLVTSIAGTGGTAESGVQSGMNILMVADEPDNLETNESLRLFLLESWNHTVTLIGEEATQAEYDAAVAVNDVAYISDQIDHGDLDTKLTGAAIGVVNEHKEMCELLDLSEDRARTGNNYASLVIDDNTHYITKPFFPDLLPICADKANLLLFDKPLAPGAVTLGHYPEDGGDPMLVVVEAGAQLWSGAAAPERRVILPWGDNFDFSLVSDNGHTILRRALEWAASQEEDEVVESPLYALFPDPIASPKDFTIRHDDWAVASVYPNLPADAISWKVTRVSFLAMQKGDPLSTLVIQIRRQGPPEGNPLQPGPPTSEILAQTTTLESDLPPLEYGSVMVTLSMDVSLTPGEGVCVAIGTNSGSDAAKVFYQDGTGQATLTNQFWWGETGDWNSNAGKDIPVVLQGSVEQP